MQKLLQLPPPYCRTQDSRDTTTGCKPGDNSEVHRHMHLPTDYQNTSSTHTYTSTYTQHRQGALCLLNSGWCL